VVRVRKRLRASTRVLALSGVNALLSGALLYRSRPVAEEGRHVGCPEQRASDDAVGTCMLVKGFSAHSSRRAEQA
jgi:hypothetical protein